MTSLCFEKWGSWDGTIDLWCSVCVLLGDLHLIWRLIQRSALQQSDRGSGASDPRARWGEVQVYVDCDEATVCHHLAIACYWVKFSDRLKMYFLLFIRACVCHRPFQPFCQRSGRICSQGGYRGRAAGSGWRNPSFSPKVFHWGQLENVWVFESARNVPKTTKFLFNLLQH